jgi:hypothetical protein
VLKSDKKELAMEILNCVIDETDNAVDLIEVFSNAVLMFCNMEKNPSHRTWVLESVIDILWQDAVKNKLEFRSFDIEAKIVVKNNEVWH